MSDAHADDFDPHACPHCDGAGRHLNLWMPLLGTLIGGAITWYSWGEIPKLLAYTNHRAIQSMLFFAVLGPSVIVGSWWKLLWDECATCKGWGYIRDKDAKWDWVAEEALDPPIEADQHCHSCEYNLRTLRVGGKCPECGTTIIAATVAEQMRFNRRALRVGLAAMVLFPAGMGVSYYFLGRDGFTYFAVSWVALGLILRTAEWVKKYYLRM